MKTLIIAGGILLAAIPAWAGPPFVTDDPEPVEYQHWEVYLGSLLERADGTWSGTAPHLEVNYGLITNVQLHLIAPLEFNAPYHAPTTYGYGDTELGLKYRFLEETTNCPQVGIFPLLEIPTGDSNRGLGGGQLQAFLPLWIEKSFGDWTTYGGGGYWINPGAGNRDWWFLGLELQRHVTQNLVVGGEIFRETAQTVGGEPDTRFNLGAIIDFSQHHHLLLSAGHTLQGPSAFQAYIAFQITIGREAKDGK